MIGGVNIYMIAAPANGPEVLMEIYPNAHLESMLMKALTMANL